MDVAQLTDEDGWRQLEEILRSMPDSGQDGFEGLIATIFEDLTGMPFLVASSGRQPLGDATSLGNAICIQAKRYRAGTNLSPSLVISDFWEVRDAAAKRLDVYVAAVTRVTAQLRERLDVCENESGVDVIVLDTGADGGGELSALCAVFWERIADFFSPQDATFKEWITKIGCSARVQEVVARTGDEVTGGLRTWQHFRMAAGRALIQRFRQTKEGAAAAGVRIDLSEAVERRDAFTSLDTWWAQDKTPNAYVEAQEGFGKSWVAAAWAEQLSKIPEGPSVLWLESQEWTGCSDLDALIEAALRSVLPPGDRRTPTYAGKIFRMWIRPVLVVLDGVNEHGCLRAAQHLLRNYEPHTAHLKSRVRILFTTRPLENYTDYDVGPWRGAKRIPLTGFSESEFLEALRKLAPTVAPESIPANVRVIAATPRLFRLALRLRERLRDLGDLDKPLLLFADLMDKIENLDPQTRRIYAAGSLDSASAILAYLAKEAVSQSGSTRFEIPLAKVRECFEDFGRIREDLAEQRIVFDARGPMLRVGDSHVVLGFALHLLQMAESTADTSIEELCDRLSRELEPNREDDLRTEAIYVALLLTLLRAPSRSSDWSKPRQALLALWSGGHNAQITRSRLGFWAEEDLDAYAAMTEWMFARYLSGTQDTELMLPLVRRWQSQGMEDARLTKWLIRWLRFVYPKKNDDDTEQQAIDRTRYPCVDHHEQLRLSFAVISMVSLRPEIGMLPELAWCAASARLCVVNEDHNGKMHTLHLKTPYENLGLLFRWSYTEMVVPKLAELAQPSDEEELQEGFKTLAECLRLSDLPAVLYREKPKQAWTFQEDTPQDILLKLREWLRDRSDPKKSHWPDVFRFKLFAAYLSVDLSEEETTQLVVLIESALSQAENEPAAEQRLHDMWTELFPWIARFATPAQTALLARGYWRFVLKCTNPGGAGIFGPTIPITKEECESLAELTESRAVIREMMFKQRCCYTDLYKTVLLTNDEPTIVRWLEVGLTAPPEMRAEAWQILPVAHMLERVATPRLAEMVWTRFEAARQTSETIPRDRGSLYWLEIYAYCVWGDERVARRFLLWLQELPVGHPWASSIIWVIARSGVSAVLDEALRTPEIYRHFAEWRAAHAFTWFLRAPRDWRPNLSYAEMLKTLPPEMVAYLIGWFSEADQLEYARGVAEAVYRKIAHTVGKVDPDFHYQWHIDDNGNQEGWTLREASHGSGTSHSPMSSVWGVDRNENGFFRQMKDRSREDAGQNQVDLFNNAVGRARVRFEKLEERHLTLFHSSEVFETWAHLEPEEFVGFCRGFFSSMNRFADHYFDFAVLSEALLRAWSAIDLDAACLIRSGGLGDVNKSSGVGVCVKGAVPSYCFQVMNEANAHSGAATTWRLRALEDCESDRDILHCVMAAMMGGSIDWIRTKAREHYGKSALAKDRALAVSLLAFAGEVHDSVLLETWEKTDASLWVRAHSEWARRVQAQTRTAETWWSEVCQLANRSDADVGIIAAKLAVIKPILPPMALCWTRPKPLVPQVDALLHAFWYDWKNAGGAKGEAELCRRKPTEYCRGEPMRDVSKRMAPWWQP